MIENEFSINIEIWGRDLPIEVSYGCFPGQEITETQKDTYKEFLAHRETILAQALEALKKYAFDHYRENISDDFSNPFRYLKPKALFVKRSVSGRRIAGLICSFRFDIENDLVAYIDNETVTMAGTQDIIL